MSVSKETINTGQPL